MKFYSDALPHTTSLCKKDYTVRGLIHIEVTDLGAAAVRDIYQAD